ncbi:MAG: hypothetical protein ABI876_09995 [Bacteroidota bacterium]
MPTNRPLKVFAFDPTRGKTMGNVMTINVPYECLTCGPVGGYLAVIDYDASNGCYYHPVNLDHPGVLMGGGLDPSESDPRFHQQMVYAVASETIRRFEYALGRRARWSMQRSAKNDPFSGKLRIYPHAMQEANAFYDRERRALLFGYFPASESDAGANLPGQTIFTCLSHDIIVHETTHALIDGQREFFLEPTSHDTLAFHEGFADIVALLQHFSFKEALLEVIQKTGGALYQPELEAMRRPSADGAMIMSELRESNPLVQLARQFGEAMGMRGALRSAIGTRPNTNDMQTVFEPHLRGAILVAAVFDAFFTIYVRRTEDLMRIARASGRLASVGEIHPDLANRLADQASRIASHFSNICIRAIDYCPPVDISFGDFLRAMVTADRVMVPNDPHGYRAALIDAFRLRGIQPQDVPSYAEESLLWSPPEEFTGIPCPDCSGLIVDPAMCPSKGQIVRNHTTMNKYGTANAQALGLTPGVPIQCKSFHPIHRVGPDGRVHFDIVTELVQQRTLPVIPGQAKPVFKFRGGTTLILNQSGKPLYSIMKKLGSEGTDNSRLARQRAYFNQLNDASAMSVYMDVKGADSTATSFDTIHRGF